MKDEVKSAGDFIAKLLCQSRSLPTERAAYFSEVLQTLLRNHYSNHWFPEKPFKGSAYRCLRINSNKMEPLISSACQICGVTNSQTRTCLPSELTIWIDPQEVSYRIGENGSVCVLYSENGNSMDLSDEGDVYTDSSANSSPSTSPSKSPVHFQRTSPHVSPRLSPVNGHVSSMSSNTRHTPSPPHWHTNHNVTNFQQRSSPTSGVTSGCSDVWITNDQSLHNIQKLSAYVYS